MAAFYYLEMCCFFLHLCGNACAQACDEKETQIQKELVLEKSSNFIVPPSKLLISFPKSRERWVCVSLCLSKFEILVVQRVCLSFNLEFGLEEMS